jgi:hypothetical protein
VTNNAALDKGLLCDGRGDGLQGTCFSCNGCDYDLCINCSGLQLDERSKRSEARNSGANEPAPPQGPPIKPVWYARARAAQTAEARKAHTGKRKTVSDKMAAARAMRAKGNVRPHKRSRERSCEGRNKKQRGGS